MSTLAPSPPGTYNWMPPPTAEDSEILKAVRRIINPKSRYRRWHMTRMAMNLWFYRGRHWIEPESELAAAGTGAYVFREISRKGTASFRRPVDNKIAVGVDNLVTRLGRKEYVPETRAEVNLPEARAAKRTAKNVLMYDLDKQMWPELREENLFNLVATGTCSLSSYWDENAADLTVVASPDAAACPSCMTPFASARVPELFASLGMPGRGEFGGPAPMNLTGVQPVEYAPGRPQEMDLTHCPLCQEPTPLQPYQPSVEEVQQLSDPFGRPLGIAFPKGDGLFQVDSMNELYVENGGIGVTPATCKIWALRKARPLEWIFPRIPEEFHDLIKPESPNELMKEHPILGDASFAGMYGIAPDDYDVYANHAAVDEVHVEPLPGIEGLERGACYMVVKDQVAYKGELYVEIPTPEGKSKLIPKVKHAAARYKRIPGEFWGRTPVDDAVPLNRRLNELDAQMIEIRERGIPFVALQRGTRLYSKKDNTGALNIVEYDSIDDAPINVRDAIINGQPLTGTVYMTERESVEASLRQVLGPQPVEEGFNQSSVKSGQQLALLSEEAAQKRGTPERALVAMYEQIFQHHLEITWAFRKETEEYTIEDAAGMYSKQSYRGQSLTGGCIVKVDARGAQDESLAQAQKTQSALAAGLYDLSDPAARETVLDLLSLPKVNESQSIQIERANQHWSEFEREGKIPIIDPTLEDAWINFQVLGLRWQEDAALDMRRAANFDEAVKAMAGWERKLQAAADLDMRQRAIYEQQDPAAWDQIFKLATTAAQQQAQVAQTQSALMPGAPPAPPPQMPPPPPQNGQFLPEYIPDRLLMLWHGLLGIDPMMLDPEMAGMVGAPPEMQQMGQLDNLLQFYAVIQAYRLTDQANKEQAAMGLPKTAAPGGGRSSGGMEPANGQPVIPAAGSDAMASGAPGQ